MRICSRSAIVIFLATVLLPAVFGLPPQARQPLTVDLISNPERIIPPGPRDIAWRPRTDQFSFINRDSTADGDAIWLYNAATRQQKVLLDPGAIDADVDLSSYQWSPDGGALLLEGGGNFWLYSLRSGKVRQLTHGPGRKEDPAFSPRGDQIGFVENNNLYVLDVQTDRVRQLTTDGGADVLNGKLDWVYGEELAYRETSRAFEWSPDGKQIAYLRLNDGPVPQYPLTRFLQRHATVFDQRFPQPGDPNPIATMRVVGANGGQARVYHLRRGAEYIVPAFGWTPDSKAVCFLTMNRDQTRQVIHLWSAQGDKQPLTETDRFWINNVEPPQFIDGGKEFLWLSERDGWNHLYLYTRAGKLVKQLNRGDWLIDHPIFENVPSYQVDRAGGWVYFESTDPDPREREIYRERLDGSDFERLTTQHGTHALTLSPDGRYLIDKFSSIDNPPVIRLLKSNGTRIAVIDKPSNHLSDYELGRTQFVTLKAPDGSALYARLVTPPDFDPHKKYPVVVFVYGGPGFQVVRNQWGATSWMDRLLADHGYLIWSMDNHGSAGRGHAFESVIFKDMGKHELSDQLLGVKYLKSLPYVDPSRLGVWGWSYGGYLTLYILTHAPGAFKCGIAGAPVTDWHYYDSIYTERYMRTPEENPKGYEESSDVLAAGNLRAKLLLIHGVADDNVHLQNTINFIEALVKAGIPYQLYLQPAQKHGFTNPTAIRYLNQRMFEFFMKNL